MKKFVVPITVLVLFAVVAFLFLLRNEGGGLPDVGGSAQVERCCPDDVTASDATRDSVVPLNPRLPIPSPVVMEADQSTVPPALHFLFGWGDAGTYQKRNRKINALGRDLSSREIETMLAFLHRKPHEVGLDADDFHATGDTLMEKLEAQYVLHPDYTDHLAMIFYDESFSGIWRDYCLQHIGATYKRMASEKLPVLRQLYNDALKPGSGMEGVAVLAMKNSIGGKGMTEGLVSEKAFEVASNPDVPDASRLSALLVAAELKHPEALAFARQAVGERKKTAHLRVAAIATIGMLGDASDLPLLEKKTRSSDIRMRGAANAALAKLNRRQKDL